MIFVWAVILILGCRTVIFGGGAEDCEDYVCCGGEDYVNVFFGGREGVCEAVKPLL